jgi:sulfite reductase (ferredoxin)
MTAPTPATTWSEKLEGRVSERLDREIDIYETQIELRRQGKLDEKIFAETRLRRGVYGQRYDNGQRHDGFASRELPYPSGELTKGPSTVWDAPGMVRIKIPFGGLVAEQLEVLADVAEEYSDGIAHVTTRQDFQLHFVHIDDTPDLMRRLAAVGITTQEACGNSVRNVTGCPLSGVCHDEAFDVSPYARALTHFLLGHQDAQDFGRKFKISFSGCMDHPCALAHMHDLGVVAKVRNAEGSEERGFAVYVGGGLGAVPHQAKLLYDFLPAGELLPVAQAICRVFARLGEKRNRGRARIKFLVAKLGIDEFRRLVEEERRILPLDEQWTAWLDDLAVTDEAPTRPPSELPAGDSTPGFSDWRRSNTAPQRQEGYAVVTVHLPLGDLTATQLRALADISRRYNGGRLRTTVEQNLVLRYVPRGDLPELHDELEAAGLAESGAGTLVDITACPGTDTCKLGISSSRGLAAELRRRVAERRFRQDDAVQSLRIKVSGCFNSCGQHHIADIGFYGVSRKHGNHAVPHFQVILGGQQHENAAAYGLAVVAVPSKRIPEVVDRVTALYVDERQGDETFQAFTKRVGKARIRALLEDLTAIPDYTDDPTTFSDWGDPREYTIGDLGVGECAGEVVSSVQFGLAASERQVFEAQVLLDEGAATDAADKAYRAMLQAAKAVIRIQDIDVPDDPEIIVGELKSRFVDTELFHDKYAGAKFANYLFAAHAEPLVAPSEEDAHRRIEEAQLFIEAAHSFYNRSSEGQAA